MAFFTGRPATPAPPSVSRYSGGFSSSSALRSINTAGTPPALPAPPDMARQFQEMFPQGPSAVSQMRGAIPRPPTITAPQLERVQLELPDFDQLRESLFTSQFDPIRRELGLRAADEETLLRSRLAQSGLAESGVAIGQQQKLQADVSERVGAAASQVSAAATAAALEARLQAASQQAQIDQQRSLAQGQLDYGAQQQNARNILEFGTAQGQLLLGALGLDEQRAESIRSGFLSFLDSQTKARLQASEIARQSLADVFNAALQGEALVQRTRERMAALTPTAQSFLPPPPPPPPPPSFDLGKGTGSFPRDAFTGPAAVDLGIPFGTPGGFGYGQSAGSRYAFSNTQARGVGGV